MGGWEEFDGWVENRGGLKGVSNTGVKPRVAGSLTGVCQLKSVVDWKGCQKNTGVGPRVGWFLTVTRQLKSVVDWREWQTTRGRTTGGWVCVRHVSTEECSRLKGVLNTGMACQLKSVAGWKGCQTQAYNHGWLGFWQACVNRRAQWIGRDVKKHRCRSTGSWFSDSQVSSEKRSGLEGM